MLFVKKKAHFKIVDDVLSFFYFLFTIGRYGELLFQPSLVHLFVFFFIIHFQDII